MTPDDKVFNELMHCSRIPIATGDSYPDMIILGGGRTVYEDYFEARKIMPSSYIMGVNDIAGQFRCEPMQHAVSLHTPILPAVQMLRREKGMLDHLITHSNVNRDGVECVWEMENVGGTSGLFAVKIALLMGSRHIIICGIPMDNSGHYFDPPEEKKKTVDVFTANPTRAPWVQMQSCKRVRDRVRSMSGYTAELFGKPTKEWATT